MSKSYEEWEKVNEVLGRYSFHGDTERLEEMAERIVLLEDLVQSSFKYMSVLEEQIVRCNLEIDNLQSEITDYEERFV